MKKDQQSTPEIHLHEHNAPTYHINIGYVDKQINGDYYEFNYPDGTKQENEVKTASAKALGQPKKVLFITAGTANEENIAVKKQEAQRLKKYIKEHHMSNRKLTTRKDDTLNEVIVAFLKRWQDSTLIGEQLPGAAVFRFLTEDVGLETEVSCESFAAKVKTLVANIDVSVQTNREVGKSFK